MSVASVSARQGGVRGAPRGAAAPRVLGGACAEVARRLNAPAGFVRAIVVVACWFSPRLILVYVAAVLLVPHRPRRWPGWENIVGGLRVGLLYGVVYAVATGGVLGSPLFDQSPAVWIPQAGILLATVVALFASPWIPGADHGDRELALASLALIALAGLLVAGMALAPTVRWEEVAAAVVALAGATLIVGGRRARPLLVPALIAACGLVLLAASGARLQGGVGHVDLRPSGGVALQRDYRLAIGTLHVDLSGLLPSPRTRTLAISVGIGHLELTVPATAAVQIDARVGRGTLLSDLPTAPDAPVTGFSIVRRIDSGALSGATGPPVSPAAARRLLSRPPMRLRIDVAVGIGSVLIDRGSTVSARAGSG